MSTPIQRKPYLAIPKVFPYAWCSDWGEDIFGLWCAFTYRSVRQVFRWIDAGEFLMGSPEDEAERVGWEWQHRVKLTEGFWMADTACTQELWEAVMGENPAKFKGDHLPVEEVSWDACQEFITKLNEMSPGLEMRMPTEAWWEYACRAGTTTPFSFGENITTDQVNYDGNYPYADGEKGEYREKIVPVRSLPPNQWGLYEMHGNVYEWCADWWDENYYRECEKTGVVENPQGSPSGGKRVVRGGGWDNSGRFCRSAYRFGDEPGVHFGDLGFRLSRGQ